MSETGDRLRALFDEIAPPLDVRAIMEGERAAPRPRRGWVIAVVAGAVALVVGGGWLLLLGGRVEAPGLSVATTPAGSATSPEDSATTATEGLVIPLQPASIQCTSGDVLVPCDELIDGDPATTWFAPAGGADVQITVYFEPPVRLFDMALRNAADVAVFRRHARIASVDVSALDLSQAVHLSLLDTAEQQTLPIGFSAVFQQAGAVILRVKESYPGAAHQGQGPQDTLALAEVEFRGWEVAGSGAAGTTLLGPTVTTFAVGEPVSGEWLRSSIPCCGPSGYLRDLVWDGGQFLALARHPGDASVWRSEDGLTWDEVAYLGDFPNREGPGSLDHGEAGYLAGGSVGDMATVWYSSDGANWTPVTLGPGGVGDVAVTSDGLVAVGTSERRSADAWQTGEFTGVGMVWTSADGLTWQAEDLGSLLVYSEFYDVYLLDGRLVAVGSSFTTPSPLDRRWLAAISDRWGSWEVLTPASLSAFQFDATALVHRYLAAADGPDQTLWMTADGESWLSSPLGGLAVQSGGTFAPQALAGLGEALVVAGLENYLPPGEAYNRSDPAVWLREPDGTWRWAAGAPVLDPRGGGIYKAAASLNRVVLVLDHADDRLLIWVFRPEV